MRSFNNGNALIGSIVTGLSKADHAHPRVMHIGFTAMRRHLLQLSTSHFRLFCSSTGRGRWPAAPEYHAPRRAQPPCLRKLRYRRSGIRRAGIAAPDFERCAVHSFGIRHSSFVVSHHLLNHFLEIIRHLGQRLQPDLHQTVGRLGNHRVHFYSEAVHLVGIITSRNCAPRHIFARSIAAARCFGYNRVRFSNQAQCASQS